MQIDCWGTPRRRVRLVGTGGATRLGKLIERNGQPEPRRTDSARLGRGWVIVHTLVIDDAGNAREAALGGGGTSSPGPSSPWDIPDVRGRGGGALRRVAAGGGPGRRGRRPPGHRLRPLAGARGHLRGVARPAGRDPCRGRRRAQAGVAASFVTESGLPFPIAGAIRVENHAQFHPRRYLLALAENVTRTGSPNRRTVPTVGLGEPMARCSSVVLPAPLGRRPARAMCALRQRTGGEVS